jgi:hypothetical protein
MAVFRGPEDPDDDKRQQAAVRHTASADNNVRFGWFVLQFLRRHRGKVLGLITGLAVGFGVRYLGFLWTLFIGTCALVGYFVGKRLDESHEDLLELLDRVLPPGRG